jgi:DNA-binding transcriptional ArsR family regulator
VFENRPLVELAIGRSTVRQRILALLMYGQETRLHLREIQRRVGTSPGTASRELARLVAAGLVDREAEGNQVYFRASSSPVATMMRHLLLAQADRPVAAPTRIPRAREARAEAPAVAGGDAITPSTAVDTEAPQELLLPAGPPVPATAGATAESVEAEVIEPTEETRPTGSVRASDVAATAETAATADGLQVAEAAAKVQPADVAGPADLAEPADVDGPFVVAQSAGVDELSQTASHAHSENGAPDPLALVVAARFSAAIRPLYGDRIEAVFLYGARATGTSAEDADVELLVVLDEVSGYGEELERTSTICAQLSYELGLVVSRLFVGVRNWIGPTRGFVAVLPAGAGEA